MRLIIILSHLEAIFKLLIIAKYHILSFLLILFINKNEQMDDNNMYNDYKPNAYNQNNYQNDSEGILIVK
jgi:hypothetical protein